MESAYNVGPLPETVAVALHASASAYGGHVRAKLCRVPTATSKKGAEVWMEASSKPTFGSSRTDECKAAERSPLRPNACVDVAPVLDLFKGELLEALTAVTNDEASQLCEIRLDAGLPARVTEIINSEIRTRAISEKPTLVSEIEEVLGNSSLSVTDPSSKRMHIDGTLHRVTAIFCPSQKRESGSFEAHGLTIRLGRHISQAADILCDIVLNEVNGSLLVLGEPGSGKTTVMRSMIRLAAGDTSTACNPHNHVVVLDTSRELCGDSIECRDSYIGYARCITTSRKNRTAAIHEALTNHFPTIIAMDEICTDDVSEIKRACTSGVRVFATAHASSLESALHNATISPLLGGVHCVTRGDASSNGARKSILERSGRPLFDTVVQIIPDGFLVWQGHSHLTCAIDDALARENSDCPMIPTLPQKRMWPPESWKSRCRTETIHMLLGVGHGA